MNGISWIFSNAPIYSRENLLRMRITRKISREIRHMAHHMTKWRFLIGYRSSDSCDTRWARTYACCLHRGTEKVFINLNGYILAKIMDTADSDNHPRPRRSRHDSSKHYDATRRDLQLSEVLDVLQCYVDYGGGINCCVCGKPVVFLDFSSKYAWIDLQIERVMWWNAQFLFWHRR
jgi:hypothetical protein